MEVISNFHIQNYILQIAPGIKKQSHSLRLRAYNAQRSQVMHATIYFQPARKLQRYPFSLFPQNTFHKTRFKLSQNRPLQISPIYPRKI